MQEQCSRLLSSISFLCDHRRMTGSAPRTARERARAEITAEILDAARGYLATDGAPALSLRAIARDLGMASSALYRYFSSRDQLLTRLIIDAYDSLGAAAEAAEVAVDRNDLAGRFAATCIAVRDWALAHPNEYALIYGSPVPGYVAPADTVRPASRVTTLLLRIIVEAASAGRIPDTDIRDAEAQPVADAVAPIRSYLPPGIPAPLVQRTLMVWTNLFGVISFELFGQLHNVVAEPPAGRDAFFAESIRRWLEFTAIS
jgi:AcrR family transcriptional regulator